MSIVEPLLRFLGVPGTLITAAVVLFSAYHIKSLLDVFTRVGIWVRIGGAAILLVVIFAVLVPGFEISVEVGRLFGFGRGLFEGTLDLVRLVAWGELT
ncbi:hypothetical protein [Halobaculum rubrum]|uniref:hypothetical protein n=1 Tax=Halobaculum rubrum TaxID=2872158 RepID=UPI001CA4370D|nr:hypothetical protein [Halobaculum rubrum]QZX98736.1 hypothetical protein K6T25_10670 [Halobaculum rubrum]